MIQEFLPKPPRFCRFEGRRVHHAGNRQKPADCAAALIDCFDSDSEQLLLHIIIMRKSAMCTVIAAVLTLLLQRRLARIHQAAETKSPVTAAVAAQTSGADVPVVLHRRRARTCQLLRAVASILARGDRQRSLLFAVREASKQIMKQFSTEQLMFLRPLFCGTRIYHSKGP
jgi:hypothetical protein